MRLNLLNDRKPDGWARIRQRARRRPFALEEAYHAMVLEQGLIPCGFDCGRSASHVWHRTPAELKATRRKNKGERLTGEPICYRCQVHVPMWRVSNYSRLVQGATVLPLAA